MSGHRLHLTLLRSPSLFRRSDDLRSQIQRARTVGKTHHTRRDAVRKECDERISALAQQLKHAKKSRDGAHPAAAAAASSAASSAISRAPASAAVGLLATAAGGSSSGGAAVAAVSRTVPCIALTEQTRPALLLIPTDLLSSIPGMGLHIMERVQALKGFVAGSSLPAATTFAPQSRSSNPPPLLAKTHFSGNKFTHAA